MKNVEVLELVRNFDERNGSHLDLFDIKIFVEYEYITKLYSSFSYSLLVCICRPEIEFNELFLDYSLKSASCVYNSKTKRFDIVIVLKKNDISGILENDKSVSSLVEEFREVIDEQVFLNTKFNIYHTTVTIF